MLYSTERITVEDHQEDFHLSNSDAYTQFSLEWNAVASGAGEQHKQIDNSTATAQASSFPHGRPPKHT